MKYPLLHADVLIRTYKLDESFAQGTGEPARSTPSIQRLEGAVPTGIRRLQTTGVAVSLTKAPIRSPSECRMHEGLDDVSIYQHRPNNA
jgi:hypothetical protein